MAQDEIILVAIEEMARQIEELNKSIKGNSGVQFDFDPLTKKLGKIESDFSSFKEMYYKISSDSSNIASEVSQINRTVHANHKEVIHKYVEVNKPHIYIITCIGYFIISLTICLFLLQSNSNLSQKLEVFKANDMKYRFIKLHNDNISDLPKHIVSTSDLIYSIDSYYKENSKEVKKYVLEREEAIKKAYEAEELARQRKIEAKKAIEEAKKLKEKSESIKIN